MTRWGLALALLSCLGCEPAIPGATASAKVPNIVLIISDDHGYTDFGFMGSTVARTPNIDSLARSGMTFPTAYNTASVCRPSLATLLTGLEPIQWDATEAMLYRRIPTMGAETMIRLLPTLPRLLGDRRYASFQAGKHWEGSFRAAGFTHGLKQLQHASLGAVERWSGGPASLAIGRDTLEPVERFVDAHQSGPFLLWFAPMLPHTPHDAPQRYMELYSDAVVSDEERRYLANVSRLDDVVGELLHVLDQRDLLERTLIVFLTDNGWEAEAREAGAVWTGGRRGKGSMYELGWRTPLIFSWPGTIPSGQVVPGLISTTDVFPTLLDYARVSAPSGAGHSLRPVLEGRSKPAREVLYGSDRGIRWLDPPKPAAIAERPKPIFFARTQRWRYIWNSETSEDELYDIVIDPGERRDISENHPEIGEDFRSRISAWHAELDSPAIPTRR